MTSPHVIHSYLIYIKENLELDPSACDMAELRSCALVKTNKGFVNPSTQPVHFSLEYGNKINLKKEFPSKLILLSKPGK